MTARDWSAARTKVKAEGRCRTCQRGPTAWLKIDPAHIIPRSQVGPPEGEHPDNIIPLCRACHRLFDDGKLDLVPHLTRQELGKAFELGGFEHAIKRLAPKWHFVAKDPA